MLKILWVDYGEKAGRQALLFLYSKVEMNEDVLCFAYCQKREVIKIKFYAANNLKSIIFSMSNDIMLPILFSLCNKKCLFEIKSYKLLKSQ